MIVAIHQPEYLPWLGFLEKAWQADLLVLLDTVPFSKGGFQNRNRIRTAQGWSWLTVPVLTRGGFGQLIREVPIDNRASPRWREKTWRSIEQAYARAPYFPASAAALADIYAASWERLAALNFCLIRVLFAAFGLRTRLALASAEGLAGRKETLLLDICRRFGATTYLSGVGGRGYLDESSFQQAGIEVRYQEFHHPIYRQCFEPFEPAMSAIDLLFNYGPQSLDLLTSTATPRLGKVFT
ncbi:MAG: WbqC family protein [Candidatus Tectomicrobia bacterium]|nr:WbqC family protein [Candidatus Tectomicrobia bacterium]